MTQVARIIGTRIETTRLIEADVGIGIILGTLILGVIRNPFLRRQLIVYTILGFTLSEVRELSALILAFLLLYVI